MKKILQILSLILIFISTNTLAKNITNKSLDEIMNISGLNEQISQYPDMAIMGMDQAKAENNNIEEDKFSKIKELILTSYNPQEMLSIIKKEIKLSTSQEDADVLIAWYKSPLGLKITQAEKDSTTTDAYKEMLKLAPTLIKDTKRVHFARLVDRQIQATQMAIQIQKNTSIAVFSAMSKIMNPEEQVDIEGFKIIMAAQDKQIQASIQQMMILSFVYSYKDIDIDSLEKYVIFLQKDNVNKFNQSVVKGILKAFDNASKEMSKKLN